MKFDVYEYTSQGGRSYNEDSVGSRFNNEGGIFVVADGLGGHNHGEDASRMAIETIVGGWEINTDDMSEQINAKVSEVNNKILELQKRSNCVMKTTAAILAIDNDRAVMANTGDSRVYFFHNNEYSSVQGNLQERYIVPAKLLYRLTKYRFCSVGIQIHTCSFLG